jgi:hypothetical protein
MSTHTMVSKNSSVVRRVELYSVTAKILGVDGCAMLHYATWVGQNSHNWNAAVKVVKC